MRCPKCDGDFESFRYEGIDLDRCSSCEGLWFDAAEREQVAASERPEAIDSGSRRTARRFNEMTDVDCPRCATRMTRVADREQSHIEYEFCPACRGSFFDAGEFRDLSKVSLAEKLKRILEIGLAVR